jgi:hypothetical protein
MSIDPTLEALRAEQTDIQFGKKHERTLQGYDVHIFPDQNQAEPGKSRVVEFLRAFCRNGQPSLEHLLLGLRDQQDGPVSWADMGGGRGIAIRQLMNMPLLSQMVDPLNVDLFDWGLDDLFPDQLRTLEETTGVSDLADFVPPLLQADVTTVDLPKPADLITSVQSIQYLNDPLGALCNWYNQLEDGGLVVAASEHSWSLFIEYPPEPGEGYGVWRQIPTQHFMSELGQAGIGHAFAFRSEPELKPATTAEARHFTALVMQKEPNTKLQMNTEVESVSIDGFGRKSPYYTKPEDNRPITVVPA